MNKRLVLALGGNALSPPHLESVGYAAERDRIAATAVQLRRLANQGYRLLIVHGNGPQVGRLLAHSNEPDDLDVLTAQTQGELGYLLAANLPGSVCIVTRVEVALPLPRPVKAIGRKLREKPIDVDVEVFQDGWRVIVPSPLPKAVLELPVIESLLQHQHVIAGGGGGVPVDTSGQAVNAVVDKDRVACLLASAVGAEALVFATNVNGVRSDFGTSSERLLRELDSADAQRFLDDGGAGAGSMAPKLESALAFARETGRPAHICDLADIERALANAAGTRVRR